MLALPAALVDQPARRQLLAAVRLGMVDEVRIHLQQAPAFFARHHRILEEAAGIADLERIGQLAAADRFHDGADSARGRRRQRRFLHRVGQFGIAQVRLPGRRQRESDVQHDEIATNGVFEDAVAVAEAARGGVQAAELAAGHVESRQAVEHILGFDAIRPHVLDGRGADRAGDQRQVFQSPQALVQREPDEGMPVFSGLGAHEDLVALLAEDLPPLAGHVQHQAVDILGEQQVAAAAQHQARQTGESRVCSHRSQLLDAGDAQVAAGRGGNAEGIQAGERLVVDDGQVWMHVGRDRKCRFIIVVHAFPTFQPGKTVAIRAVVR